MRKRMTLLLVVVPLLNAASIPSTAAGKGACDPYAQRLRAVLLPDSSQPLNIETIELPVSFPGTLFCRGRRVPPFPRGHESRPDIAAAVVIGHEVHIVTTAEDLTPVWRLRRTSFDPDSALTDLLDVLDATGVVLQTQLVRSPDEARRVFGFSLAERYVRQVQAPIVRRVRGGWRIRVFSTASLGLERYEFTLTSGGILRVNKRIFRSLVSP